MWKLIDHLANRPPWVTAVMLGGVMAVLVTLGVAVGLLTA